MNEKQTALANMHQLFLEALRHREQEIFRYLAILGPALGGFVWLLHAGSAVEVTTDAAGKAVITTHVLSVGVFVVGTISVLLLLLLGAVYSLALGYNYRYITLQLAKLEKKLKIKHYMLEGWPGSRDVFVRRYKLLRSIPRLIRRWVFCILPKRSYKRVFNTRWCTPPEIIKVFWWAFLTGIVGVTVSAYLVKPGALLLAVVIPVGAACLVIGGFLSPWHYGRKLHERCKQEPENWTPDQPNGNPQGAAGGEEQ